MDKTQIKIVESNEITQRRIDRDGEVAAFIVIDYVRGTKPGEYMIRHMMDIAEDLPVCDGALGDLLASIGQQLKQQCPCGCGGRHG